MAHCASDVSTMQHRKTKSKIYFFFIIEWRLKFLELLFRNTAKSLNTQ
jgi:hypothetical protein